MLKVNRILISAYGCEPGKGSEQGVGWNWVLQLARLKEVIVITRSNNREDIEAELPEELVGSIRFVYYDLPASLRQFKRKERGLYLYYLMWQWGAYRLAREEIADRPVSLAMHLTFGSIWLPTFMHRLPVPFIWGPLGGGEAVPWALIGSLPMKSRAIQYLRFLLIASLPLNTLFFGAARKAKVILTRTEDTARVIPKKFRSKTRTILETAAAEDWFDSPQAHHKCTNAEPVRAIYTGRLVAFKNLDLAIRAVAIARARGLDVQFLIVGEGPLEKSLSQLVAQMGITDAVTFAGRQTQKGVFRLLSESDVYLFPSLREGGPWSLMEAMAVGLPSICVRTSGMAVIVEPSCAQMIEPTCPAEMIEAFADALCDLGTKPELRREMGSNARKRLKQEFRWEQKGAFMKTLLDDLERGKL